VSLRWIHGLTSFTRRRRGRGGGESVKIDNAVETLFDSGGAKVSEQVFDLS